MNSAEASMAVLEELKRLRREGVREIYIEDKTIDNLATSIGSLFVEPIDQEVEIPLEKQTLKNESTSDKLTSKKDSISIQIDGVKTGSVDDEKFLKVPIVDLPKGDKLSRWKWLEEQITECKVAKSELNENGNILFGRGSLDADVFFCGEAPIEEDDLANKVFGGKVGELLSKIIQAMGYEESSVYLSNILHWRPKYEMSFGHRPPTIQEMNFSLPYLIAQIEIIKPKVLVALGKTAVDGLLGPDKNRRLGDVRGDWHEFVGVPLMITYHPSYLLHNPSKSGKRKVWEDMLKVMERVGSEITERQKNFFL